MAFVQARYASRSIGLARVRSWTRMEPSSATSPVTVTGRCWGSRPRALPWILWVVLPSVPYTIASAAAVIAAAIFINKAAIDSPANKAIDWFLGVGDDQALICQTYYSKAAEIYEEALRGGIDESTEWQMALMLRDDAALIDQLPDEMSNEERAEVLKDYYGALLDGMNKMK